MAASTSSSMEDQLRLDEQQQLQPLIAEEKDCIHKTKLIHFLGRSTPIILQNENGPCPLLAICNVLLLRNNLSLSPETTEVSQEKLLSLVAERLIDSNSNVNNKDAGYIENQQQNIADAIDLLPRLATGIDVNIKFRRIGDFEFTRECAIFDLLDIPLYHGWIVDPKDYDTADSIGSKSYNFLMGELVALETQCLDKAKENNAEEEDCIDFAAATTAALGVPSPCLSKTLSFDNPTHAITDYHVQKRGDREEESEILRALELSVADVADSSDVILSARNERDDASVALDKTPSITNVVDANPVTILEEHSSLGTSFFNLEKLEVDSSNTRTDIDNLPSSIPLQQEAPSVKTFTDLQDHFDQLKHSEPCDRVIESMVGEKNSSTSAPIEGLSPDASEHNGFVDENTSSVPLGHGEKGVNVSTSPAYIADAADIRDGDESPALSIPSGSNLDSESPSCRLQQKDDIKAFTPKIDDSEPIYEGEECILDPSTPRFEDREPVYEGEVALAEQADKGTADEMTSKIEITPHQGELIRNFLRNNASQLTIYGLYCLQDGLKERELCVFFRNNHFCTMFKYEGELYLLATDQGYINQPDLVWEKLNEVNGNTLFMTGNFKEFSVDNQSNNSTWDEHNAVASTADYMASIDSASQAGFDMNSDLQLAIALQQQEFYQQQQQHHTPQQTQVNGSRLVTSPQVPRNRARYPPSSSRAEEKKSDKCSMM